MPDHVHNKLTITGPKKIRDALVKRMKSDNSVFDFENLIPMPETLHVEADSRSDAALAVAKFRQNGDMHNLLRYRDYPWIKSAGHVMPESLCEFLIEKDEKERNYVKIEREPKLGDDLALLDLGKLLLENLRRYGHSTWYDWAIEHWGTKWNAYDVSLETHDDWKTVYHFDTAWSDPRPVLEKLIETFPGVDIDVWCSGEVDQEYGYYLRK